MLTEVCESAAVEAGDLLIHGAQAAGDGEGAAVAEGREADADQVQIAQIGNQRLWIIGGCALLGLGATVWCVAALRNSTRPADPMFSASLAELQEDLRQLKAASGRE